jgi:signal transduction histidine kinase/signal recognition particle receptor subunit beta
VAQWSLVERTLYAKLVYYGPALGGKTTNLRVIHNETDPERREKLISVNTADDRTLFFDLLPFDLGSVLGYKVALKLFTVPGQVRYDATRRVVLAGADAVVFVADSDASRERDNRQAWDDLAQNMRATRLDPTQVPILVQFNKRDLAGAAPEDTMRAWFGLGAGQGVPAVACQGQGVLETFLSASHAMLERIVAIAEPQTRRTLDAGELAAQLDLAFAPYLARRAAAGPGGAAVPVPSPPIVLASTDLLESAVASSVVLGAQLADEHGRASRLTREAESLRRLSDTLRRTGASFERDAVLDAALTAAIETVGAEAASLGILSAGGRVRFVRSAGRDLAPLMQHKGVASLLARMLRGSGPSVVDDLAAEVPDAAGLATGVRALAVVPVEPHEHQALVVIMPAPDGAFTDGDVRFLATLAGHLAVGLEKVRIHEELRAHRDRLEEVVAVRTRSLRKAYEELKSVDAMKDRFLANVSHEMRSPLTAIIGAATFLRDYEGNPSDRREMAAGILGASQTLEGLVDGLLRAARLDAGDNAPLEEVAAADIVADALGLAGALGRAGVLIDPRVATFPADPARLARALSNLLDNALKFGPKGDSVELNVSPCVLGRPGGSVGGVAFAVLDRGPGLFEGDVERAFAPFEQGGDPMTGKPTGVGLGLYEARAIARRHGGTVIYLPRDGGGSEFRMSIPAEAAGLPSLSEARRA